MESFKNRTLFRSISDITSFKLYIIPITSAVSIPKRRSVIHQIIFLIVIIPWLEDNLDHLILEVDLEDEIGERVASSLLLLDHPPDLSPTEPSVDHCLENLQNGLTLVEVLLQQLCSVN